MLNRILSTRDLQLINKAVGELSSMGGIELAFKATLKMLQYTLAVLVAVCSNLLLVKFFMGCRYLALDAIAGSIANAASNSLIVSAPLYAIAALAGLATSYYVLNATKRFINGKPVLANYNKDTVYAGYTFALPVAGFVAALGLGYPLSVAYLTNSVLAILGTSYVAFRTVIADYKFKHYKIYQDYDVELVKDRNDVQNDAGPASNSVLERLGISADEQEALVADNPRPVVHSRDMAASSSSSAGDSSEGLRRSPRLSK